MGGPLAASEVFFTDFGEAAMRPPDEVVLIPRVHPNPNPNPNSKLRDVSPHKNYKPNPNPKSNANPKCKRKPNLKPNHNPMRLFSFPLKTRPTL